MIYPDSKEDFMEFLDSGFTDYDFAIFVKYDWVVNEILSRCDYCDYKSELNYLEETDDDDIEMILTECDHGDYYDDEYGSLDKLTSFRDIVYDKEDVQDSSDIIVTIVNALEESDKQKELLNNLTSNLGRVRTELYGDENGFPPYEPKPKPQLFPDDDLFKYKYAYEEHYMYNSLYGPLPLATIEHLMPNVKDYISDELAKYFDMIMDIYYFSFRLERKNEQIENIIEVYEEMVNEELMERDRIGRQKENGWNQF